MSNEKALYLAVVQQRDDGDGDVVAVVNTDLLGVSLAWDLVDHIHHSLERLSPAEIDNANIHTEQLVVCAMDAVVEVITNVPEAKERAKAMLD